MFELTIPKDSITLSPLSCNVLTVVGILSKVFATYRMLSLAASATFSYGKLLLGPFLSLLTFELGQSINTDTNPKVQSIAYCTRLMYLVLYLKGNLHVRCMADLPVEVKRSLAQEFFDFLKTFGIIGLAIAFVIGQAASKLVTALVDDIITPFIGLFLPAGDLKAMSFTVGKSKFMWGDLISNIIDFLIIAIIVFLAYRQLSKFKLVEDKTKSEPKK